MRWLSRKYAVQILNYCQSVSQHTTWHRRFYISGCYNYLCYFKSSSCSGVWCHPSTWFKSHLSVHLVDLPWTVKHMEIRLKIFSMPPWGRHTGPYPLSAGKIWSQHGLSSTHIQTLFADASCYHKVFRQLLPESKDALRNWSGPPTQWQHTGRDRVNVCSDIPQMEIERVKEKVCFCMLFPSCLL